ncbi:hypothetical protein JL475_28690 [Streptomyces sp. M2CJ-2]|uniref:hypothetical protein n=1 Tax=Streptomyces sp. M2CJ-2 TaxID=2803948 RepID=UPI001925ADE5|nr:hypothetical protein [Streptomyces sp. M2CJ-2]MBL3669890.1 hypothetical protein [Streptomyces sp. M2CJ-2]
METTDAAVDAAEMTGTVHRNLDERRLMPGEHVGDAGYVTAAHILTARDEHGITLLGPVGLDPHHGKQDDTGPDLSQRAFSID